MAGLLNDPVNKTLRQWANETLRYGTTDCAMSVFRYLSDHYNRPRAYKHWAATYDRKSAADDIIRKEGGAIRLFQQQMKICRLRRTKAPKRGDVGLVRHRGTLFAAICCGGGRWAVRVKTGFSVFQPSWYVAYGVNVHA